MWIESSANKKYRARKTAGGDNIMASPTKLLSSLSISGMATGPKNTKDNSDGNGDGGVLKSTNIDLGRRAGVWGPKRILTRQENKAGAGPVMKP